MSRRKHRPMAPEPPGGGREVGPGKAVVHAKPAQHVEVEWLPVAVTLSALVALWVIYRIATCDFVLGSVEGGWFHPYGRFVEITALWTFLAVAPCAMGLTWLATRMIDRSERACVLAWWAAAIPLQLALRYPATRSLETIIRSDSANSFYSPTLKYSAFEFLSNFEKLAPNLPEHASSNMPGKVLLYFLLQQVTVSPQVMGYLLLAISNLGAVLVYFIVRDLFGHKRAALYAMILYFFIPAKLYFFPLLNSVAPAFILLCLFLHVRFLLTGHAAYALALGVSLYATLLFEPLPLAAGLIFAALFAIPTLPTCATPAQAGRTAGRSVLLAALGFATVHGSMLVLVGFDVIDCFLRLLADAQEFNTRAARPYWLWMRENLIDFSVSVGVVALPLAILGPFEALRLSARWRNPSVVFGFATLATLAVLDVLGINRGETFRLWIFLTVFFEVNVALLLARTPGISTFCAVLAAVILQVAVTLDVVGFM